MSDYCQHCSKLVRRNHRGILCDLCKYWFHLSCTSLLVDDYRKLANSSDDWFCRNCLSSLFPFNNLDDLEFINCLFNLIHSETFNIDYIKNSRQLSIISKSICSDDDIDPDLNLLHTNYKNSPYYLDTEFNDFIDKSSLSNANFSILHINARSLQYKINTLLGFLNNLKLSFSIIAVSETWANDSNEEFLNIPGYNKYLKSRINKPGGGVALYIKDNLSAVVRNDLTIFNDTDIDAVFVDIVNGLSTKVTVGAIYRPPGCDLISFNEKYCQLLDRLSSARNKCFIAGDFNINLLNYESHHETEQFLNNIFSHFQYPTIVRPTRFCSTNSTLIDNIFVNNVNDDYYAGLFISDISDHLPIFYISGIKLTHTTKMKTVVKSYRNFDNSSIDKFQHKLSEFNWFDKLSKTDVNSAYDDFLNFFSSAYNECFPLITKKIKFNNYCKPWITPSIVISIRKKNNLYKKWLIKKTNESLDNYKRYKNMLTTVLRNAEKLYYENRFTEIQDDIKSTWKLIKSLINDNKPKNESVDELSINGQVILDKQIIAHKFNEYFINIGNDLSKKIPNVPEKYTDYLKHLNVTKSFFCKPTNASEITDITSKLKACKSAGYDDIHPSVVKSVISTIANPLAHIFNLSLSSGIFPNNFKIAKVTPVFKNGDKKLLNNYRPISVLPVFSKILEKIMYSRLSSYLEINSFLTDKQYGFREKHSTYMALVDLIDKITNEIDNKKFSLGIFIDLSKAFDTINHTILLNKLNLYGIRGVANNWFRSYLHNRLQYVHLQNSNSSKLTVKCGVPQGSILGPLLFLIHINDITKVSNILNIIMFADDTNLFLSDTNLANLINTANFEVNKISTWFKANKLSLNISKTNYIVFRTKYKSIENCDGIKIDNIKLEQVYKTKFLGVIINQALSWDDHIHMIKQKIVKNTGIIYKIRKHLPQSVLISLYHTLIHPYLDYCNIVWAINKTTALNDLFICQKKIIRIVTNSKPRDHTVPLFKNLYILPVKSINDFQVACFVFRCFNNLIPAKFCSMFSTNSTVHSYNTRHKSNLKHNYHRLALRSHTVRIYGVMLWDSLSDELTKLTSVNYFRRHYKRLLISDL